MWGTCLKAIWPGQPWGRCASNTLVRHSEKPETGQGLTSHVRSWQDFSDKQTLHSCSPPAYTSSLLSAQMPRMYLGLQ